jgi:O-antigen ligase
MRVGEAMGQAGEMARSPLSAPGAEQRVRVHLLGLALAALFAASPFVSGLYEPSVWLPTGLVVLAALGAVVLLGAAPIGKPAIGAACALGFLAVWAAVSASWAPSPDSAWLEANRALLYCAALVVLCAALRTPAHRQAALALVAVGALVVALYVELRLLAGSGGELFFGYRLNRPVGYVNGQAAILLMGFWPFVALAVHRARSDLAGALAVGAAAFVLELAVLTQSRSGLVAFAVSAAVCVVLARRRLAQLGTLLAIGAGVAVAAPWLLAVYEEFRPEVIGHPSAGVLREAGLAAVGGAVVAAVVWFVAATAYRRLDGRARARARRVFAGALAAVAVTAVVVGAGSAATTADRAYDDFRSLDFDKTGTQRFTQGGGHRYDLWRIAVEQGRAHPLKGVGAGNYGATYFRERRQPSDVRQPHSIELQAFGELGIPGALAVLLFAGCVIVAGARAVRRPGVDGACAAAALGVFVVWLSQTSVDWIHNLPGITGMALVAAAVLLAPRSATTGYEAAPTGGRRALGTVVVAAALAAIALAAVSVGRQYLSEHHQANAEQSLARSPVQALESVRRSFDLGAPPVANYYVAAAAYARLGSYADARAALHAAAAREPANNVPWLLLGDLEMRRGSGRAAVAAYDRSKVLNPLDAALPARISAARELIGSER